MTKDVYDPDDDGVIAIGQTEADMKKANYDPNEDGKIALSIIDIDADLAMGAHNITLDAGKTVDGIDVSNHTHCLNVGNQTYDCDGNTLNNILTGTYTIITKQHNFNTIHAIFIYKIYIFNRTENDKTYKIRLYVNGVLKKETTRSMNYGTWNYTEKVAFDDMPIGNDIDVKWEVYITGASTESDVGIQWIDIISYSLASPS